jgi:alanine dehydrogenase
MRVGVPKEIKDHEFRVGLVPSTVAELARRGHEVLVEPGAGTGSGISDDAYAAAGAAFASAEDIFQRADLIVKVKEPLASERRRLRRGQILFTYLHLAPDRAQTEDLIALGVTAVGYETVTDEHGRLPLLTPMSEVAGRMAAQVGAHYLERPHGGRGVLLGGVPGVAPADVVVIGTGSVGANAAHVAACMGADVTATARNPESLRALTRQVGDRVRTEVATSEALEALCLHADLVIAAALQAGAAAPNLISEAMVKAMKPGSVIVDVAIDQGGNAETSRPTTHSQPVYILHDVVHYCVTNMPGAVPRTSTFALNNATRPFVLALADKGLKALSEDVHLRNGLNVHEGLVTCRAVADALRLPFTTAEAALGLQPV